MMHPADLALQQSFPTVMVPRFSALAPLEMAGERLLIAANGVFLEIVRPWLRVVRRMGAFQHSTALPYGDATEATELRCGRVPAQLIGEFAAMARSAHPVETGAWIVWNAASASFRLIPVRILEQSSSHLNYDRPRLADGEVLVVDCHSHGRYGAGFSSKDDADDRYDVKFAFVVGHCGSATLSMALRLCAKGIFEKVETIPAQWYDATCLEEQA
ncbi:hypothetical protein LMG32289_06091 [Cupriavidus pampae]|uniref:PRTRC system protein A n=2 Tax=Cupriavidus pampae TaxID=659251 RepID=A0ABN7ZN77_9BURK|nr:hypothetical protein LMG32289_06091 [Cupriavidus pampae]